MGILSTSELTSIRNACEQKNGTTFATLLKGDLNAAAQVCEDFLANNQATVSNAIDAAISPKTMSAAAKKKLFAEVVRVKYERDK